METRRAISADLDAILGLFRLSLGDEGGIPEPSFWKWKHEQNPFGKSPVLLAFEDGELVGLRTFMCWRFRDGQRIFRGYRAVDTATHPRFQGKGIFRKLSLQLIDELKNEEQPSIIYNTPNNRSMPGYLKMGWKVLGKTRLLVRPFPLNIIANRFKRKPVPEAINWNDEVSAALQSLLSSWKSAFANVIVTDVDIAYLQWRYADVPGFNYQMEMVGSNVNGCAIFYRVKDSGRLREARITDVFFSGKDFKDALHEALRKIDESIRPDVITVLDDPHHAFKHALPWGYWDASSRGLTITCREVNDPTLFETASSADRWYFSSGCLELF